MGNSYLTKGKLTFLLKFLMAYNMSGLTDWWGVLTLDEFALTDHWSVLTVDQFVLADNWKQKLMASHFHKLEPWNLNKESIGYAFVCFHIQYALTQDPD